MENWRPPTLADRKARRRKTFYPTTLTQGTGSFRGHLLDLSASGALAHSATPPEVGAVLHVALGEGARSARVIWVDAQRFGVAFAVPFTDAEFGVLLDRIAAPQPCP